MFENPRCDKCVHFSKNPDTLIKGVCRQWSMEVAINHFCHLHKVKPQEKE